MFTVDPGVVNSSDFRDFGAIVSEFRALVTNQKKPEIQATFFFGLAPSQRQDKAGILPCARLPRRSARTTSARGGLIERCCVCGAAAGSKGAAGAAGSRNDTRGPLGGLGAHPSPSRTQSPGAARRRAAGAQRAGEPIGCKAARPRGCASPPGIFAMAAECKPPALAVAGVSPAEEEDAQRLLAQWMELSQREAGPVSARVRVRPGWAAPSWPAPPCSRSPCVVAGRRPRVPSCSAGRSGRPRAVSLVRRRRPRRCVHDTGAQRLLCPGGRGWLAPRYT